MKRAAWLIAAAVTSVALAGCVTEPASEGDALAPSATGGAAPVGLPELGLSASGCVEGGGHSVHPKFLNPLPKPWQPADIMDDVGPQLTYSEVPDPMHPVPEKGYTMGNYHATVWCDEWLLDGEPRPDMIFGFVGMKVESPRFGTTDPTHEYLVTVVATNDDTVHERLMAAGIHAMKSTATYTDVGADWLRIQMWTDHNGAYDSLFLPKELGPMEATHVRLWFQHEAEDGTYRPVSLDLLTSGGTHFGAEGQGYFSHSGTHHHDPLPGAYGHTAALYYEGFDRTFTWGPQPDVRIAEAYHH